VNGLGALAALIVVFAVAGPAAADSLVFIKNDNVWLANADGSSQYQVTLDGTAGSPYSSPSQADDGTIVALRTPFGARPQIWRMHQNGGLLNGPINTPAPGTGAIDARVSPDGRLVAYWFVTEVNTGPCLYCFDVSGRVLISRADQFTNPDAVGTPNTGSLPSWMSNNTLLMSNGNATQWYYTLGMPEAAEWWGDSDNCSTCIPSAIVGLTDGEVSRDGQRIALVRGDNNETIVLYKSAGAPPALPSPECAFNGAVGGKFSGPTWSQDGTTLAWQEGNGIWSDHIPDIANCATIGTSKLIVPGATEPDFGPFAVNPGARPACGNPGNPTTCTHPPPPKPTPHVITLGHRLGMLLTGCATALKHLAIHGLLRKHRLSIAFQAPGRGTLTLTLSTTGKRSVVVASGRLTFTRAGTRNVVLALTSKGMGAIRHARTLHGRLKATFTPRGARGTTSMTGVTLSK
jgi:hypothetical protein